MESPSRVFQIEALAEHGEGLRSLARRLIGDPHAADDALQETWLAVLQRRMRHARAPRAWFRRALANSARMLGRSEVARARRERAVARPETAIEDPAEIVARAELQQRLIAAVLRLDEPYRSTVLMRDLRGRSTEEIARAHRVAPSTVRGWHARAVTRLRAELDRDFDRRSAWVVLLTGVAREGTADAAPLGCGPATASGLGGLAMTTFTKWMVAAVAASVTGAFLWMARGPDSAQGVADARKAPDDAGREPLNPLGSELGDQAAAETELEEETRAPVQSLRPPIVGWVRTPSGGLPIHGAELVRHVRTAEGSRDEVLASTNADGRMELAGTPVFDGYVTVRAADHLERRLGEADFAPRPGEEFTVTLAPLGRLDVRVVDELAVPIAGLPLSCRAYVNAGARYVSWNHDLFASARTDEDGRALIENLACGVPIGLGAFDWERATTISEVERRKSIELVLPRPGSVRGIVVDAEGELQPGVVIALDWEGRAFQAPVAETDVRGAYEFECVPPLWVEVSARAAGAPPRAGLVPRGDVLELEPIVLPALVAVEGRVQSRFAFAEFAFAIELYRDGVLLADPVWTDADGHFRAEVAPGSVWLCVNQESAFRGWDGEMHSLHRMGEVLRTEVEAPASGLELWVDSGQGVVTGTLPVSLVESVDVNLHYCASPGAGRDVLESGQGFLWQEYELQRDGPRFQSEGIRPGTYAMTFEVPGIGTALMPEVSIEAHRMTDVGELVLMSASVRGRVVDAQGSGVEGASVALELTWSDGVRLTTDAHGDFEFTGLAAGLYWVYASADDGRKTDVLPLEPGEERELLIELEPPAALSGRVLRAGRPAPGVDLRLHFDPPSDLRVTTPSTCGQDGSFDFGRLEPGRYSLEVEEVTRVIELQPGETRRIEVDLDAPRWDLWILAEDGSPSEILAADLTVLGNGHARAGEIHAAELLEEGRVRVALVDAQAVLLARVAEFDGPRDAAFVLDLRLAPPPFLTLPSGILELTMEHDALGGPPPELSLEGFPGLSLPAPRALDLARERIETGWRFLGIPPQATLQLRGVDGRGNEVVRTSGPAAGTRREQWP